jgi:hypothetical protein
MRGHLRFGMRHLLGVVAICALGLALLRTDFFLASLILGSFFGVMAQRAMGGRGVFGGLLAGGITSWNFVMWESIGGGLWSFESRIAPGQDPAQVGWVGTLIGGVIGLTVWLLIRQNQSQRRAHSTGGSERPEVNELGMPLG